MPAHIGSRTRQCTNIVRSSFGLAKRTASTCNVHFDLPIESLHLLYDVNVNPSVRFLLIHVQEVLGRKNYKRCSFSGSTCIADRAPTKTMVQRSGRNARSAGCPRDNTVEYKILGTWKRPILHFCIPNTQVRTTHLAAIQRSQRTPESCTSSSREPHDSLQTAAARGRDYLREL